MNYEFCFGLIERFLWGMKEKKNDLCSMDLKRKMVSLMLPSSVLTYFEVVKIEDRKTLTETLRDELYSAAYRNVPNIECKEFMSATTITDFPIRDHKLQLPMHRHRWIRKDDGVSFCRSLELASAGTCYSKEFAVI